MLIHIAFRLVLLYSPKNYYFYCKLHSLLKQIVTEQALSKTVELNVNFKMY